MVPGLRNCPRCNAWFSLEELSTHSCGKDGDIVVDSKSGQKILYDYDYTNGFEFEYDFWLLD
jgi:hypothetical protein